MLFKYGNKNHPAEASTKPTLIKVGNPLEVVMS